MTPAAADSCAVGTEKAVAVTASDPAVFVAALNRNIAPDPDPDPEFPPVDGPQLLAMLKAGAVSLPPGETRATLARATIRSGEFATVLESHDVQTISKAFPNFNLADTLGTARTGEMVRFTNYSRIYRLSLPTLEDAENLRTALREVREVLFVHYDGSVGLDAGCTFDSIQSCPTTVASCPNDPLFGEQWPLVNWEQSGGTCDADIDVDGAWEFTTGSVNVKIGIFDTGIADVHEDVAGKVTGEFLPPASLRCARMLDSGSGSPLRSGCGLRSTTFRAAWCACCTRGRYQLVGTSSPGTA